MDLRKDPNRSPLRLRASTDETPRPLIVEDKSNDLRTSLQKKPDILKRFSISMNKIKGQLEESARRGSLSPTNSPPPERIPIRARSKPEIDNPKDFSLNASVSEPINNDSGRSPPLVKTLPRPIEMPLMSPVMEGSSPISSPKFKTQGFSAEIRKTLPAFFERMDKATKKYRKTKNEFKEEIKVAEELIERPEYHKYREDRCPLLTEPMQEHLFYILFELAICFFFFMLLVGTISFTFNKIGRDYGHLLL